MSERSRRRSPRGATARLEDLRSAIARGEVVPHYQPIVDVRSGRVLRVEALARWAKPGSDVLPPARFLPLAERSGAIGALFISQLAQVLRDLAAWRSALPELRASLNLSARGLARATERIRFALYEAQAEADWLSVEITENVVMDDVAGARKEIEQLRSLGVRVEIDDFGTGYSSLRYLQLLPIDAVKIDRQFIEASVRDRASETIVRAVIGLCHELGFEAVAEGVATREVWDLLAALGCDSAQGHLVAPAMPAAEVREWLGAWERRRGGLASAMPRGAAGPAREGTGPRVLVVDDEPGILSILKDVLREEGYRVETAANGAEALRSVEALRPALVLLDMHMPILDGEGFVRALRERGISVPTVVMTAGPAAEQWARRLDVQGAIPKPFGIADVVRIATRLAPGNGSLH